MKAFGLFLLRAYLAATAALRGDDERLSFSKLITIAVLVRGEHINPVVAIAVLAASFGVKAFMAYLERSTFKLESTVSETIKREIQERRNGEYEVTK